MSTQQIVGNVLVIVSTLLALAIVVLYHLSSPWRRSEAGRHLMTFTAVIAVVLLLTAIRVVAGAGLDTPWFQWVRTVVFVGVPIVLAWRLAILWRAQFRGRSWAEIRGRRRHVDH